MGEIAAIISSLACAVAIVVVLLVYNNKPTPKLPKGATLNALVSVLATGSKAGLLFATSSCLGQLKWIWYMADQPKSLAHVEIFDEASRGPLGALSLVISGPRDLLGLLGATLTLLALAYDPFVQQIIDISPEVRFTPSTDVLTKQATRLTDWPASLQAHAALMSGIYSDRFERVPACATGNCTFPNFSSVEWCSQCSRPTDWQFEGGCSLVFEDADFRRQGPVDDWYYYANRTCKLISGSGYSQSIVIGAEGAIGASFVTSSYSYDANIPFFLVTEDFYPQGASDAALSIGTETPHTRYPWGGRVPMGEWATVGLDIVNWSLVPASVNSCTLDLCLRDYKLNVTGGTTRAEILQESFGRRYYRSSVNFAEISFHEAVEQFDNPPPTSLTGAIPLLCWEPSGKPSNSSWEHVQDANVGEMYVSPSDFAFCMSDADFFWNWDSIITTSVDGNWSTEVRFGSTANLQSNTLHFNSSNMILSVNNGTSTPLESHNGTAKITTIEYDTDNVNTQTEVNILTVKQLGLETMMANLAASLTQLGLQNPSTNDITGNLGRVETVVHVRWPWLALPGTLVVGVALLLLATILSNRRARAPIWKSSANALLYHGLDDDVDEDSGLVTLSSMEHVSSLTNVALITSMKNARLVLGAPSIAPESRPNPSMGPGMADWWNGR
jgi:multisubunit Na+/H+ antiporter MnhB subunit